jgi:hypothetical protein
VASDFFDATTMNFRLQYGFVVIHHRSRRLLSVSVTQNPTADWTRQQMREAIGCESGLRLLIHDRDSFFRQLNDSIRDFRLKVIRSSPVSPRANAICERVIGNHPARMPGLDNPTGRGTPARDRLVLGCTLQPGTGSRQSRAWNFRSGAVELTIPKSNIKISNRRTSPRVCQIDPRWLAS